MDQMFPWGEKILLWGIYITSVGLFLALFGGVIASIQK